MGNVVSGQQGGVKPKLKHELVFAVTCVVVIECLIQGAQTHMTCLD